MSKAPTTVYCRNKPKKLEQQRDELLAAMKDAAFNFSNTKYRDDLLEMISKIESTKLPVNWQEK